MVGKGQDLTKALSPREVLTRTWGKVCGGFGFFPVESAGLFLEHPRISRKKSREMGQNRILVILWDLRQKWVIFDA